MENLFSDESKWSKCVGGQGSASDSAVEITATPGHLAGLSGEGRRLENNGGPVKRGRGKERKREIYNFIRNCTAGIPEGL